MKEKTKLEAALDELLSGKSREEIVGPEGLLKQLTKAVLERAMGAEMTHHLGYEKGEVSGRGSGNNRNGQSRKKVQGDLERSKWRHRAIGTGALSRRFCRSTSGGLPASTKRFCRCTPAG
jgi:hypothetical protein